MGMNTVIHGKDSSGNPEHVGVTSNQLDVLPQRYYPAPGTTYTANFHVLPGGKVVLPADPVVLTSTEIPYISAAQVPASTRRINLTSFGTVGTNGAANANNSNLLGWAVVLNAATQADAETELELALDTGDDLLGLNTGSQVATNDDSNVIIVPLNGEINMESSYDITTVHAVPIGLVVTATGGAILSVTLMPAPSAT